MPWHKTKFVGAVKYEAVAVLWPAQGGLCAYCAVPLTRKRVTLDHVMPLCVGGADEFENLLAVCKPCNQSKGSDLPLLEFHETIRRNVHTLIRERAVA